MNHPIAIIISASDRASSRIDKVGKGLLTFSNRAVRTLVKMKLLSKGTGTVISLIGWELKTALAIGSKALSLFTSGLSLVVDLFQKAAVTGALFLGTLTAIGAAITATVAKTTTYAAEMEGLWSAFRGIAREGAPEFMRALKEASSYMLSHETLLTAVNKGYTLVGDTLMERLPEALRYLTKVAYAQKMPLEKVLDSLVTGVGRLSTRWRVQLGVVVDMSEAIARASEMYSKLGTELTYSEKQAGMLDVILQKLAARTANMIDPIGTMKQLTEAWKASMKDLSDVIGRVFLPVGVSLYKILFKSTQSIIALVSEGGRLYPVIQKISATLVALIELFTEAGEGIASGLIDSLVEFAERLEQTAWDAIVWGANIATNLAIGLVQGASTALLWAAGALQKMFGDWFAPSSPPRFLPDWVKWAAATFTEYLKGFTLADFGVLKGLQPLLKGALGVLADLGEISDLMAAQSFIDISLSMAEALKQLAETGTITNDVFEKLRAIGGGYGEVLEDLFKNLLALAQAQREVADAEERLAAARKLEEVSGKKLSKAAREYNRLLKEGASPAVLRAKLKEAKAAYKNLKLAREQKEQAEDDLEAAKEKEKYQQEQVRLQQELLRQLIAIGRAQVEIFKQLQKEAAGPGYDIPDPPIPYLQPIETAFGELVERIKDKFRGLWADLMLDWEASGVGQMWSKATEAFQDAWTTFEDWWAVEGPLFAAWIEMEGNAWVTWWEAEALPRLTVIWVLLEETFKKLWGGFTLIFFGVEMDTNKFWDVLRTIFSVGLKAVRDLITKGLGKAILYFTSFYLIVTSVFDNLKWFLDTFYKIYTYVLGLIARDWEAWGYELGYKAGIFLRNIWEEFGTWFYEIQETVRKLYEAVVRIFRELGVCILDSIVAGIREAPWKVENALRDIIQGAIDRIRDLFKFGSPSKVFMKLGQQASEGFAIGLGGPDFPGSGPGAAASRMAGSVIRGAAGGAGAGTKLAPVIIQNYFGYGSVRSNRDIAAISEEIARSNALRGVRTAIA